MKNNMETLKFFAIPILIFIALFTFFFFSVKKADKEIYENRNSTYSKEIGKGIGNIVSDFQEGLEQAKQ